MATSPATRQLSEALAALKALQDKGSSVFQTDEFSRRHRESLQKAGFIQPVIKGWYMASRPEEKPGDTTPWYAAMDSFLAAYATHRFGNDWHASPDLSILLHAGTTVLPKQFVIHSLTGSNNNIRLPDGYSLFDLRVKAMPSVDALTKVRGISVLRLPTALSRVEQPFYRSYPRDAQIVLAQIPDASELNRVLLEEGRSHFAGRLAGAFRAIGRQDIADDILGVMQAAGYTAPEVNPFEFVHTISSEDAAGPAALRVRLMWADMRERVLEIFPPEPGLPADVAGYLSALEDVYKTDAYHSLSIEGYKVSDAMISKVANGDWHPEESQSDKDAKNAMAARGYWLAHIEVKRTIEKILTGANAGQAYQADHAQWYRQLFAPSVDAGILTPADLAGYRGHQVYIRNAKHVPPPKDAVRQMMPELIKQLRAEPSAAVRAVLGHFVFVFVHPYMDGNGRLGRFLMNAMLGSGGYPWTIIQLPRRAEYMEALNAASFDGDIRPFAEFVRSSMENPPAAI
ncbi:Fic family protein [Cupriavidus basilensis]|uniref:Fic family protein n=1 Tax=Cupriavidus basilensis TaxID=68895 RepID=A0ABT6ANG3_9BURK|nr:Fic family protein [Cupriavidus basilensis]MDF3834164.1 Fic family protein [Cupriavidus basilensis]